MPSLAEQALMVDALTFEMDREFPRALRSYRDEAARHPNKWRRSIDEARRRNLGKD